VTRAQGFGTAVLTGVILGIVLEPTVGRWMSIVIAVAVAAGIDGGSRRLRVRRTRDRRNDD